MQKGSINTNSRDNAAFTLLVTKASKGSKEALVDLCQAIVKGILFRTTRILGNQTNAEDVTQEVLIRVCTYIHELKEPGAFYIWLNRIIINETNRYLAKNSRHGVLLNIEDYQDEFEEANKDFLPQEYAIQEAAREAVIKIVDRLPEQQRKAILLYYYDGLTLSEAASVMGVSQPRVSRCIKFAQEKIKKELTKISRGAEGAAFGFALLPLDTLLSQVLYQEAAIVAHANSAVAQGIISNFSVNIGNAAASAAGSVGTNTGGATSAASPVGVVATIAAVVVISAGALFAAPLAQDPPDFPPAITVEYSVEFIGGDAASGHVNPTRAEAYAQNENERLNANKWWISSVGSGAVLYSGEGGVVENALAEMISRGENGAYILNFEMQNSDGYTWTLSRQFIIATS